MSLSLYSTVFYSPPSTVAPRLADFFHARLDPSKETDEAERYYKLAVEADPNNAHNLGAYALFLSNQRQDYDEAELYFKRAVEIAPKDALWLGAYAVFLYDHRHDYDEAERYFKLAAEADPNNAHYSALLMTLARVNNEEAGIEELETDADWRAA